MAELQALKVDPDLDCSPPKRPTAPQAEEEEIIPETPHEEAEEERMLMASLTKKRKTRQTVKEKNLSISAPMIEVSGPDGLMMVCRPQTVNDMRSDGSFAKSGRSG